MQDFVPSERGPLSVLYVYKSKLLDDDNGRELTYEEEQMFHPEVEKAKRAEAKSWCDNDTFDIKLKAQCSAKCQSSWWVVRWKRVGIGADARWIIKVRLRPRGYADMQGSSLYTKSPTAGRVSQRVLISVASIFGFDVASIDIPVAFLQGDDLNTTSTREGEERVASMSPPGDFWDLLPEAWKSRMPFSVPIMRLGLDLLKSVYGLKDAPLMWTRAFFRWILCTPFEYMHKGAMEVCHWIQSQHDEAVFFLRSKLNDLLGMMTVHVDDAAIAADSSILNQFQSRAVEKFGKHGPVKRQEKYFQHVGHDYARHDDGSYSTSQATF